MWSINNQQGLLNSFTPNSELQQPIEFSLLPPEADQREIDEEDKGPAYNPLRGTGLAKGDKVEA